MFVMVQTTHFLIFSKKSGKIRNHCLRIKGEILCLGQ
jgi:hypothetical protein